MPLTDAGALAAANLLIGAAFTNFSNANARLGVGDSTTAFAKSQTDLQAATNKLRKPMDSASYPSIASNVITFRATFVTTDANYAWNEWGVFNAASGGAMFTRKVENLGTKPNTQSWQFTVDITVAA